MNRTARKVLVALSALVCLGILLRLLAASPAVPGPLRAPVPVSLKTSPGFPSLPWEPFRHPGDELVLVSTILQAPSSTAGNKLDLLAVLASEEEPPLVRGLAQFATAQVLLDAKRPRCSGISWRTGKKTSGTRGSSSWPTFSSVLAKQGRRPSCSRSSTTRCRPALSLGTQEASSPPSVRKPRPETRVNSTGLLSSAPRRSTRASDIATPTTRTRPY